MPILEASNETRVPELVPYRFGRMAASPFALFRGSAAVMAADLAGMHAVARFAARYADQGELDHAALLLAIADGRLAAETEPRTGTR